MSSYSSVLQQRTSFQIVKKQVEDILIAVPETRQNDKLLVVEFLKRRGIDIALNKEEIDALPTFESIPRARRIIQYNECRLQPEDNEVFERRRKGAKIAERKYSSPNYSSATIEGKTDLDLVQKHIEVTVPPSQIKKVRDPNSEISRMHDALMGRDKQ